MSFTKLPRPRVAEEIRAGICLRLSQHYITIKLVQKGSGFGPLVQQLALSVAHQIPDLGPFTEGETLSIKVPFSPGMGMRELGAAVSLVV